jgi:hypothetical protein
MTTSLARNPFDLASVPGCADDRLGALFVLRGDLEVLRADAHLVPTDSRASVTQAWSWLWAPGRPAARRVLTSHRRALAVDRAVIVTTRSPRRVVVAANTAITEDVDPLTWLREGLDAALHAYGTWLHDDANRQKSLRGRPLLAMPVVGTERGGLAHVRGAVIKAILDVISTYQSHRHRGEASFDVALVCRSDSDYVAVQSLRRARRASTSAGWLRPLEVTAAAGQLGVMFGAGASVSLDLPTWPSLLDKIAADLHLDAAEARHLGALDPVDAASLLVDLATARRRNFAALLRRHVTTRECSVTHALIANLRPALAITTNYDAGYENAVRAMGEEPPAVLPWEQPRSDRQPRLLKLHGDVTRGSIILSREDFVAMNAHRRPLGSLLQERMMVGHLLAVGTTMSDPTLVMAAEEVSSLLRSAVPGATRNGTVVLTEDDVARRALLARSFAVVVADHDGATVTVAARRVDILLDHLAMVSHRGLGFLLDEAYDDLVTRRQKGRVALLRELQHTSASDALGRAIHGALRDLGRQSE